MSRAQATRTIKFLGKGRSYTAMLVSRSGDLYQEYEGDSSTLAPAWTNPKPEIQFIAAVSGMASAVPDFDRVEVWVNTRKVIDSQTTPIASGVYTAPDDTANNIRYSQGITLLPASSSAPWRIILTSNQFVKDMYPGNTTPAPFFFKVRGYLSDGADDYIEASLPVSVAKSTGEAYMCTIGFAANSPLSISTKDPNPSQNVSTAPAGSVVTMLGMLLDRKTGAIVPSGVTFRWYELTTGGATEITDTSANGNKHLEAGPNSPGNASEHLVVREPGVDSYALFRCDAYLTGATTPAGTDTQGLMDTSDPYDIDPNPDPASETITEGTGGSVSYTPRVVKREASATDNGTPVSGTPVTGTPFTYNFTPYDAAGVSLASPSSTGVAQGDPYTVTEQMCLQAGGDVQLIIEAIG